MARGERLDRRQRLFVGEPGLGRSSGLLEDVTAVRQPGLLAGRLCGEGGRPRRRRGDSPSLVILRGVPERARRLSEASIELLSELDLDREELQRDNRAEPLDALVQPV